MPLNDTVVKRIRPQRKHAIMPRMGLEEWAQLGTTLAAFGTLGLVGVAFYQMQGLRDQIQIARDALVTSERSAEAATHSADAAEQAVREATRTRADEQAPRVIALLEPPRWPPYVDRLRTHIPNANESGMFEPATIDRWGEPGGVTEFAFPEQRDWLVWFLICGVLINEGRGTARVLLDGETRYVQRETPFTQGRTVAVPPFTDVRSHMGRRQILLRPGDMAVFEWATGHAAGEWADKYDHAHSVPCRLVVNVLDSTEHAIHDVINIDLGARPLEPMPNRDGQWRIRSEPNMGITIRPTERRYRGEGDYG